MKILSLLLGLILGCGICAEEMTVSVRRANIRKTPSTKGSVIRSVKQGEVVPVKAVKDGWAELDNNGGFISASLLKKKEAGTDVAKLTAEKTAKSAPEKNAKSTAEKTAKSAPEKAEKSAEVNIPAAGKRDQPFSDFQVTPGSRKDVTVKGMLYPVKGKGGVRYALLEVSGGKYVVSCFVHTGKNDVMKPFANKDVQLVGSWYKVAGWKHPVMQVRRCREVPQN